MSLLRFVTDGGEQRVAHRLDTDAQCRVGKICVNRTLNRPAFLPLSTISTGRERRRTTDGGKARKNVSEVANAVKIRTAPFS